MGLCEALKRDERLVERGDWDWERGDWDWGRGDWDWEGG